MIHVTVLGKSERGVNAVSETIATALAAVGMHVDLRNDTNSDATSDALKGRHVRIQSGVVRATPGDLEKPKAESRCEHDFEVG